MGAVVGIHEFNEDEEESFGVVAYLTLVTCTCVFKIQGLFAFIIIIIKAVVFNIINIMYEFMVQSFNFLPK